MDNSNIINFFSQTGYDPEDIKKIENGTRISLISWATHNNLNSHLVAAPITKTKQEVSGFVPYKNGGLKQESKWELVLPDGSKTWFEDIEVKLRHFTSGRYLGVTDNFYPEEWGFGERMKEVVAESAKTASTWRVALR